jgi:hypothetical protein
MAFRAGILSGDGIPDGGEADSEPSHLPQAQHAINHVLGSQAGCSEAT